MEIESKNKSKSEQKQARLGRYRTIYSYGYSTGETAFKIGDSSEPIESRLYYIGAPNDVEVVSQYDIILRVISISIWIGYCC